MCLLSCQFYYTYELILMRLVNNVHFRKEKQLYINILISLLKLMRNIWKYHFSGEGVHLNSIMDNHCRTAEGGADLNRMAVDVM